MKRKIGYVTLVSILSTAFLLTACGSSGNKFAATEEMAAEAAYDNGVYEYKTADFAAESSMASGSTSEGGTVVDTSRKLITTMDISTETENLDTSLDGVQTKVKELGGYIESSNIYNGSRYAGRSISRDASLTLRIPADKLDDFISFVEGETNITNKSTNVEDVTLQYVDMESKKNALKTEEKRLLEILESAETVEDLIAVESRLSDVRYQLESTESQLRTYDNLVNYSTVNLYITEVTKYSPVEEKGAFARMAEGFVESCKDVLHGFVEFFVWLVVHIPQILVFAILALIVFLIFRKVMAGKKAKTATKGQDGK